MRDEQRPTKEPWLAVCLTWLVPGVGQIYAGAVAVGVLLLCVFFGLQTLALWQLVSAEGRLLTGALLALGGLGVWLLGLFHAHYSAREANAAGFEAERQQVKDPFLAVFLTNILPGVGHLYLRRWMAGVLFLVGALLVWALVLFLEFVFLVWASDFFECVFSFPIATRAAGAVLLSVYGSAACLAAYCAAPRERRRSGGGIVAVCLLVALVNPAVHGAALLVRAHVVEAFHVPTGSNAPTMMPGDRILAWKRPFVLHRGDLIVFINPRDRSQNYIKRVAAVAGETVEIKQDGVYINGQRVSEGMLGKHRAIDVYPSAPETVMWAQEGNPFEVPPVHVFVLGDNINRSWDSRLFGPIPVEDIVGKAYKRYWPPGRAGPIE